jgi:hypothetical protein
MVQNFQLLHLPGGIGIGSHSRQQRAFALSTSTVDCGVAAIYQGGVAFLLGALPEVLCHAPHPLTEPPPFHFEL